MYIFKSVQMLAFSHFSTSKRGQVQGPLNTPPDRVEITQLMTSAVMSAWVSQAGNDNH